MKFMPAIAFLLALSFAAPRPADAHPHGWIDLRTALIFDEEGRIEALRLHWLFDQYYTLFATEGMDEDGDGLPDPGPLRSLAEVNITNLAAYDYFTYVRVEGEQPDYGEVTDYETYLVGAQLAMVFTVPLVEPVDPRRIAFNYSIHDPTYFIEVLHVEESPVLMEGGVPEGCAAVITPPNPDPEVVTLAQALDRTQSAGTGLGGHFAEWVEIACD